MNSEFEQILNHYYVIMINLLLSDNNSRLEAQKRQQVRFSVFSLSRQNKGTDRTEGGVRRFTLVEAN